MTLQTKPYTPLLKMFTLDMTLFPSIHAGGSAITVIPDCFTACA
jgi:hypothetical protein